MFVVSFSVIADDYFLLFPNYGPVLNEEAVKEDFDTNGDGVIDGTSVKVEEWMDVYYMLFTFQKLDEFLVSKTDETIEFSFTYFLYDAEENPLLLLPQPQNTEYGYGPLKEED
jgi:hypothetical protein